MKKIIATGYIIPLLLLSFTGFAQTPTFLSDFEDQNTEPEIGASVLLETGSSGGMYVVPNPHPDSRNSSGYVLKQYTGPGAGGRAEYSAGRYETNEKKYIYTWKRFHPIEMFKDVAISGWVILNQWKTWPCEYYGSGIYDFSDEICFGGGIFNDMRYEEPELIEYTSRAVPSCNIDYYNLPKGYWNEFVLEIYWTNTNNGYYRIWRNDTLFAYSDNIKTLFDGFLEGTCDIYWATGLYTHWDKTGGETTDSLIAYIDDVSLYDTDSGYTISSVCPDCELAPSVPTDSNIYKVNVNRSVAEPDGYHNYIASWDGDTSAHDISNNFGQSNGIDVYLFSDATPVSDTTIGDECFPAGVIERSVSWSDAETHKIYLKNLNPSNTYTFRVLSATTESGANIGIQIWTTGENRDTLLVAGNTCNMAELTDLASDENGELTIYVQTINASTAYVNAIEIIEYTESYINSIKNTEYSEVIVFPNPVNDNLFVDGKSVPSSITIYAYDGRKVKYVENISTVNLADLKNGIYIVLVNMQDSFDTIKIIKE